MEGDLYCRHGDTLEMKMPREGDCTASVGSSFQSDCARKVESVRYHKRWYCTLWSQCGTTNVGTARCLSFPSDGLRSVHRTHACPVDISVVQRGEPGGSASVF